MLQMCLKGASPWSRERHPGRRGRVLLVLTHVRICTESLEGASVSAHAKETPTILSSRSEEAHRPIRARSARSTLLFGQGRSHVGGTLPGDGRWR